MVEEESCAALCVVVAVGDRACEAVSALERTETRAWRLVAVGRAARLARGDRTLLPEPGAALDAWATDLGERLEDEWRDALVVYVVADGEDPDSVTIANEILLHARDRFRPSLLLSVGRTPEHLRASADAVCQLDGGASPVSVSDALRALVSPFEACCVPADLGEWPVTLKSVRHLEVRSTRCRATTLAETMQAMVPRPELHRVRHIYVGVGSRADVRLSAIRDVCEQLEPWMGPVSCGLCVNIDASLGAEEILVAMMLDVPQGSSSHFACRLRALVEHGAAQRLPRDARAVEYVARLRHELDWWTHGEETARAALEMAEATSALREAGHVVGPSVRRPGGSLVAYVLGLSPFDPVEWDLSFESFTGGHTELMLAMPASTAALAAHAHGPVRDAGSEPLSWGFVLDSRLDALEDVASDRSERPFVWEPTCREDEALLELAARGSGLARFRLRTLEELAAASTMLAFRAREELVVTWCGEVASDQRDDRLVSDSISFTERTRGCILYQDQLAATIARAFAVTIANGRALARGLLKFDGREAIAEMTELGARLRYEPTVLARIIDRLHLRATCAPSRAEALADALVRVSLARRLACDRRRASALEWGLREGAHAVRLLRDLRQPDSALGVVLRAGTEVVAESAWATVRLSSALLPYGSIRVSLQPGVDFELVDSLRAGRG